MNLVEYVPDYILRNYVKIGQTVTVLKGAKVKVRLPSLPAPHDWDYELQQDVQATVTNFLPGFTEVYAPHTIHNHQVVWITNNTSGEPWQYHSTDINNVKEIRDAA